MGPVVDFRLEQEEATATCSMHAGVRHKKMRCRISATPPRKTMELQGVDFHLNCKASHTASQETTQGRLKQARLRPKRLAVNQLIASLDVIIRVACKAVLLSDILLVSTAAVQKAEHSSGATVDFSKSALDAV